MSALTLTVTQPLSLLLHQITMPLDLTMRTSAGRPPSISSRRCRYSGHSELGARGSHCAGGQNVQLYRAPRFLLSFSLILDSWRTHDPGVNSTLTMNPIREHNLNQLCSTLSSPPAVAPTPYNPGIYLDPSPPCTSSPPLSELELCHRREGMVSMPARSIPQSRLSAQRCGEHQATSDADGHHYSPHSRRFVRACSCAASRHAK